MREWWQDIIEGRLEHLEAKIVPLEQLALHTGRLDPAYGLEATREWYLKTTKLEDASTADLRTYYAILKQKTQDNRF